MQNQLEEMFLVDASLDPFTRPQTNFRYPDAGYVSNIKSETIVSHLNENEVKDIMILRAKLRDFSIRQKILLRLLCRERVKTEFLTKQLEITKNTMGFDHEANIIDEIEMMLANESPCDCMKFAHEQLDIVSDNVQNTSIHIVDETRFYEDDVKPQLLNDDQILDNEFFEYLNELPSDYAKISDPRNSGVVLDEESRQFGSKVVVDNICSESVVYDEASQLFNDIVSQSNSNDQSLNESVDIAENSLKRKREYSGSRRSSRSLTTEWRITPVSQFESGAGRLRRSNCGKCIACTSEECKKCDNCLDKPKYGGKGRKKQRCVQRKCVALA